MNHSRSQDSIYHKPQIDGKFNKRSQFYAQLNFLFNTQSFNNRPSVFGVRATCNIPCMFILLTLFPRASSSLLLSSVEKEVFCYILNWIHFELDSTRDSVHENFDFTTSADFVYILSADYIQWQRIKLFSSSATGCQTPFGKGKEKNFVFFNLIYILIFSLWAHSQRVDKTF